MVLEEIMGSKKSLLCVFDVYVCLHVCMCMLDVCIVCACAHMWATSMWKLENNFGSGLPVLAVGIELRSSGLCSKPFYLLTSSFLPKIESNRSC